MQTTKLPSKDLSRFKAVALLDPHFAASSPPVFKVNYLEFLLSNVNQVLNFAMKNNVDAVLWGGDLFHLKEPRNNPLSLITTVIRTLMRSQLGADIPNLGIGGNHDYKYGNIEAGLKGSPLEVVVAAGAYHLLDDHEYLFQGSNFSVRVAGGSYLHSRAEHVRDKKKDGASYLVNLGHFWLGKQTGEFFGEPLYGLDFFKDCDSDVIIVGHHHEDKGVTKAHGKYFVSHGSISITGAHPHDLARRPAAAYVEIGEAGIEVNILRAKTPPIGDLIDLTRHEEVKREKEEMTSFIESLSTTVITSSDPMAVLKETAPSPEILTRAESYIQQAENT